MQCGWQFMLILHCLHHGCSSPSLASSEYSSSKIWTNSSVCIHGVFARGGTGPHLFQYCLRMSQAWTRISCFIAVGTWLVTRYLQAERPHSIQVGLGLRENRWFRVRKAET
ncbi:hypothetical protein DFJ77DRAFT_203821 [Powellomyces hirtus]|nr:hypothetical protein DFJ77DRAFT_203821 [Powellomyces hirtus]